MGEIKKEYQTEQEQALISVTREGVVFKILKREVKKTNMQDFAGGMKFGFGCKEDFLLVSCRGTYTGYLGFFSPNFDNNTRVALPVPGMGYRITILMIDSVSGRVLAVRNGTLDQLMTTRFCSSILKVMDAGTYDEQKLQQVLTYYVNCNHVDQMMSDICCEVDI